MSGTPRLTDAQCTALKLLGCRFQADEDGPMSGWIEVPERFWVFHINADQHKWRYSYSTGIPHIQKLQSQVAEILGVENCTHRN